MCRYMNATTMTQQKRTLKRNRVLFAAESEVISAPSPIAPLLLETAANWKSDLWYQPADLAEFRAEVRDMCRRLRRPEQEKSLLLSLDSNTRGLEQRICTERQRRKYISNRCIVRASSKIRDSEQEWDAERLAALCQKINAWATDLAVKEGARDFDRAWSSGADECGRGLKRTCEEVIAVPERRVRARTVPLL